MYVVDLRTLYHLADQLELIEANLEQGNADLSLYSY
jgi:hypothetical protein